MRNAYALLGISFFVVFGGAYMLVSNKSHAPITDETVSPDNQTEGMELSLSSSAFTHNDIIPSKYTCDGMNMSPPLSIAGVSGEARSLVLVMDDPDIPQEVKDAMGIEKFNHWALYNLSPNTSGIKEGELVGTLGNNSKDEAVYTGPCPPTQYEPTKHRYIFRLYALPESLSFQGTPTLDEIEGVAKEIAIGTAKLTGVYERTTAHQ